MSELRAEERIVVRNANGDEAVVISYGEYVEDEPNYHDPKSSPPKMRRKRLAVLRTEDGREVTTPDESVLMIDGEQFSEVRREKIAGDDDSR